VLQKLILVSKLFWLVLFVDVEAAAAWTYYGNIGRPESTW